MSQNYITNFTRELSPFYYMKVKTVRTTYKCILYHRTEKSALVSVVFCLTFPTLQKALEFCIRFQLCEGHL